MIWDEGWFWCHVASADGNALRLLSLNLSMTPPISESMSKFCCLNILSKTTTQSGIRFFSSSSKPVISKTSPLCMTMDWLVNGVCFVETQIVLRRHCCCFLSLHCVFIFRNLWRRLRNLTFFTTIQFGTKNSWGNQLVLENSTYRQRAPQIFNKTVCKTKYHILGVQNQVKDYQIRPNDFFRSSLRNWSNKNWSSSCRKICQRK